MPRERDDRPGVPEPASGTLHLAPGKGSQPGPTAGGGGGSGPAG